MLDKEFEFYTLNEIELIQKYSGNYVVIVGNEIKGIYPDKKKAYFESLKKYDLGTFLMKLCIAESSVQTFQSQISFK